MLQRLAEGFVNLGCMAGLTAVMVAETTVKRGQLMASITGAVLLAAGLLMLTGLSFHMNGGSA